MALTSRAAARPGISAEARSGTGQAAIPAAMAPGGMRVRAKARLFHCLERMDSSNCRTAGKMTAGIMLAASGGCTMKQMSIIK